MAKLLDGTRIYGSANIDNSLIVNTMNIVPTITSSFLQANNANIYAFGAHQTANSAQIHANAAFLQANQVGGAVSTINGALTAANTNMVFKTGNTMTGNLVMSGANIAFVTNSNSGVYWGGSGLSFIHSPNSNVIVFGTSNSEDMRLDPSGVLTVYNGITVAGTNIAPTLAFAYTHANGAFNQANNANIYAFGAHRTANSAQVHANAAFLQANQVGGAVSTANGALTAANTNMVFKTGNTMTGNLVMSGANIAFVTNSNAGVYWGGSGLSFIHSPNSNVIVFGTSNSEDMRLDPNGILTVYNGITVAGTNIAPTLTFAYTHANAAFLQANNANIYAFGAHQTANSAQVHANAAFLHANAAFLQANNANIYAFGAHQTANSAQVHANAAFVKANAAFPSTGGSITGDVTISGNLIVIGNSTVFNVSSLIINDPLIFLANNNYSSDLVDIGFVGHYNDGVNAHTGFVRDATSKEYFIFNGYTPEILANDIINIAHPSFALANVNSNYYKGNLISNTVVITISATVSGMNIVPTIISSFTHANGAFLQANNANIYAFGAHQTANSAQIHANAAFLQANNANIYAFGAHQTANSAQVHANGAFLQANIARTHANAAFEKANSGAVTGNSVIYIADNPPTTNLSNGSLWWNSNDGSLYVYYGDGNSTQWVITTGGLLEASNASSIAVSAFAQANLAYTSSVLKTGNTMTGGLTMSGANIVFVTATNTGVYWSNTSFIHSSAANVLVIGTSSSEDIRIDSSGNVGITTRLGIGMTNPRSKFDIIGTAAGGVTTLTDGATITPDFASNNSFTVTLGGNRVLANATNTTIGQSGVIYVAQDGTGSRTLSFGLAYKFPSNAAPTLTTTANAVDAIIYSVRTANSYVCQVLLNVGNRNDT